MVSDKDWASAAVLAAVLPARMVSLQAEVDGEQLQQMMRSEAGKVYAQVFIDDVWQKCNGGLFLSARW